MFTKNTPMAAVIDFDGTVTDVDVVDGLLLRFAPKREWMCHEEDWLQGRISSDVCMQRQLKNLRVSPKALEAYLRSIHLDPDFKELVSFFNTHSIPFMILSDGFDLFIRKIFEFHGISGIRFRANALKQEGSRLIPTFPFKNASCQKCGNCKRHFLEQYRDAVRHFVFIGDGRSDICAIDQADTLFAKHALADHCKKAGKPFFSFNTLADVRLRLMEEMTQRAAL